MPPPLLLLLLLARSGALPQSDGAAAAAPDDGYRLLDGHYVGRVGCDDRGNFKGGQHPPGNLTLTECKAKCNEATTCRGLSFSRGFFHLRTKPPTTCILKRKCSGRVVTMKVCEPDDPVLGTGEKCTPRKSNVFNYMRVIPLEPVPVDKSADQTAAAAAATAAAQLRRTMSAQQRAPPQSMGLG